MSGPARPGLRSSLRQLGATVLGILHTRLSLAGVEIQEEIEFGLRSMVLALAAAVFGAMALLVLSLLIVVALWDSYRLAALATLTLIYLGLALWFATRLRETLAAHPSPLQATLQELEKDRVALQGSDPVVTARDA